MNKLKLITASLVLVLIQALLPIPASAAPQFTIKLLAEPANSSSIAWGINDKGAVVGAISDAGTNPTVSKWPRTATFEYLDANAGTLASIGYAVNRSGAVVGTKQTGAGTVPFMWQNGQTTQLPSLGSGAPGTTNDYVDEINNQNQAVGYSVDPQGIARAVRWDSGALVNLTPSAQTVSAGAFGINDSGVAVGNYNARAVKWDNGVMSDLNLMLPANFPADATAFGDARSINSRGDIAGYIAWSGQSSSGHYAYLWSNGVTTILGPLSATLDNCIAYAINDRQEVSGVCYNQPTGETRAFFWKNGQMYDPGVPAGALRSGAYAMNNKGEMAGFYTDQFGADHAITWR